MDTSSQYGNTKMGHGRLNPERGEHRAMPQLVYLPKKVAPLDK
ncbi:MAG TPA: hypothetical protein V6C64_08745 [Microcoleaceae cyanobacterium]